MRRIHSSRRASLRVESLEGRELLSTLTVTSLNDSGAGSLRQAIIDTQSGDTINFQSGLTGTIPLTSNELYISKNLTINGGGAITIDGNHQWRDFEIAGVATVTLSGLTITDGGGLYGGNIDNNGTLTVDACTISNSSLAYSGGGIYNGGQLTVIYATIANNTATYAGGGIYNFGSSTIINSTVANNTATYAGGGIYNFNTATITNSTIAYNSTTGYGCGLYVQDYTTLNNTIVALNTNNGSPDDISTGSTPFLSSSAYNNLIGTAGSSGVTNGVNGNIIGVNPQLGLLADNGGPTQTVALLAGSPAIDAGNNTLAVDAQGNPLGADQRGYARISGTTVDIGAYEYQYGTQGQGGTFTTLSTQIINQDNPPTTITQQINQYTTELKVHTAGGATISDQTFNAAFSDSTVQTAITQAEAAITATGATYTGPTETNSSQTLINTSSNTQDTLISVNSAVSVNVYIGPQTIMVGPGQLTVFTLLPGQTDTDFLATTTNVYNQTTTTTNTYLNSTVYTIQAQPITPTVTVTPYNLVYDSQSHTAAYTATVNGVTIPGTLTGTTHTLPGTYNDTWTFTPTDNIDYNTVTGTVTDIITPRQATLHYIGQTYFVTSGTSSNSARVTLTASLQDQTGLVRVCHLGVQPYNRL
jgi:hypothetical protein